MKFFVGLALNFGAGAQRCFDAALVSESFPAAVLCDGANGTPFGGFVAQEAARMVLQDLEDARSIDDARLQEISVALDQRYPDSGSTLLATYVDACALHLVGVGDSYATLFRMSNSCWQLELELERHLTEFGHPSQLIGAEVPISSNRFKSHLVPQQQSYATFLMSDGCGAFVLAEDLVHVLAELGQATPSDEDLNFYAAELADLAVSRGSRDDVSILIAWIKVD